MPPNQSCGFVISSILQYIKHVQIMPVATFLGGYEKGGGGLLVFAYHMYMTVGLSPKNAESYIYIRPRVCSKRYNLYYVCHMKSVTVFLEESSIKEMDWSRNSLNLDAVLNFKESTCRT